MFSPRIIKGIITLALEMGWDDETGRKIVSGQEECWGEWNFTFHDALKFLSTVTVL